MRKLKFHFMRSLLMTTILVITFMAFGFIIDDYDHHNWSGVSRFLLLISLFIEISIVSASVKYE